MRAALAAHRLAAPRLAAPRLAALALAALGLAAAPALAQEGAELAAAAFVDQDGNPAGSAQLVQTPNGVLLTAQVQGLETGGHGFHIHETGSCEPDFQAAGSHWAPDGRAHGFAVEEGAHKADLPNIFANNDGFATVHLFLPDLSLEEALAGDGSALMVHAQPDNYIDVDSAGARVACGAIETPSD